jgi:hypothetical protein
MIRLVIENVKPTRKHKFIFICQQEDVREYGLEKVLSEWAPGCAIVELKGVTEGAACTILEAAHEMDLDAPLMIANSDQWVETPIDDYLAVMDKSNADGFIMTMKATGNKWSYIRFDEQNRPAEVLEKQPVSDEATVGIYNYRKTRDFTEAAEGMIRKDLRVNGEFYVAPVYNELISPEWKVDYFCVGKAGEGFYGLGTPDDLDAFLANPISQKAVENVPSD